MKNLSIIIATYNSGKYLKKCIESILNQTITNFEIIIIDDGSTDNTFEILNKEFDLKKEKIYYKKIENSGVSIARNIGINISRGEYITFLDADDWLADIDAYKIMYLKAKENDLDAVICDYYYYFDNIKKNFIYKSSNFENIKKEKENIKIIFETNSAVWNKIYKRSVIEKYQIYFSAGIRYAEDFEFVTKFLICSRRVERIPVPLINYYQREESATKKYDDKILDLIIVIKNIEMYMKKENKYKILKKKYEKIISQKIYGQIFKTIYIEDFNQKENILNKVSNFIKAEKITIYKTKNFILILKYIIYKIKIYKFIKKFI